MEMFESVNFALPSSISLSSPMFLSDIKIVPHFRCAGAYVAFRDFLTQLSKLRQ